MRKLGVAAGASGTLLCSYLATTHCCERLNVFAAVGLTEPGCLGLAPYHGTFTVLSLAFLLFTVLFATYGDAKADLGYHPARTAGLSALASTAALLLFVIP